MSDEREPVATNGMEVGDSRSHVERINPGDNAAADPWAAGAYPPPADPAIERGPQRLYTMLAKGFHNGVMMRAGSTVMLYDDEVGPQHQALPNPPIVPAAPTASVQDPRDALIAQMQAQLAAKEEGLQRLAAACADLQAQLANAGASPAAQDSPDPSPEVDQSVPPPPDLPAEPPPAPEAPTEEPAPLPQEPEPASEPPAPLSAS